MGKFCRPAALRTLGALEQFKVPNGTSGIINQKLRQAFEFASAIHLYDELPKTLISSVLLRPMLQFGYQMPAKEVAAFFVTNIMCAQPKRMSQGQSWHR